MFLLNDFMFYAEDNKTLGASGPAQMYFSNINSWRVFCPLGGACCFWQLRGKN